MYQLITIAAWLAILAITFEIVMSQGNKREGIVWLCIAAIVTAFMLWVLAR